MAGVVPIWMDGLRGQIVDKKYDFEGRIVKNGTTLLSRVIFGNHWTAKVSIFDGRVVKNRGSRNSQADSPDPRGSPRK